MRASAPVSLSVRTFGTSQVDEERIAGRLQQTIDFRLGGIVRYFSVTEVAGFVPGWFLQKTGRLWSDRPN